MIPLGVCFTIAAYDLGTPLRSLVQEFSIGIIIFDQLILLNTAIYEEGVITYERAKIFRSYMRKFLIKENFVLLSFVMASSLASPLFTTLIQFLFYLKFEQMMEIFEDIDEHFQLASRFPAAWTLAKLVLLNFLVAHYFSCGFHYIGTFSVSDGKSWLIDRGLTRSAWTDRYIEALYFSFITMATVGFGDVTPIS